MSIDFYRSAVESNCYEFCIRNALSESSLMVFAPFCELHLYSIKEIYIFSQHQPLVFTNIGKANVTKHKKVVQNYPPNYLQRLCTRYRWVLRLYATEHCYLNSQKRHVSAHFYFQILSHWDFKVNHGGKPQVAVRKCKVGENAILGLSRAEMVRNTCFYIELVSATCG